MDTGHFNVYAFFAGKLSANEALTYMEPAKCITCALMEECRPYLEPRNLALEKNIRKVCPVVLEIDKLGIIHHQSSIVNHLHMVI